MHRGRVQFATQIVDPGEAETDVTTDSHRDIPDELEHVLESGFSGCEPSLYELYVRETRKGEDLNVPVAGRPAYVDRLTKCPYSRPGIAF
jgi:hypothetical protein